MKDMEMKIKAKRAEESEERQYAAAQRKANSALRDLDLTCDCTLSRNQFDIVAELARNICGRGQEVFLDCEYGPWEVSDADLTATLKAAFQAGQQSVKIKGKL